MAYIAMKAALKNSVAKSHNVGKEVRLGLTISQVIRKRLTYLNKSCYLL